MKDEMESIPHSSKNKSMRTKMKSQSPEKLSSVNGIRRKSILKKSEKNTKLEEIIIQKQEIITDSEEDPNRDLSVIEAKSILTDQSENIDDQPRPLNLQDLILRESLVIESTNSIFNLDDISDSEDMWIMDIPRTINPKDLTQQTLVLGEKSKFKIGKEKYCIVNRDVKHNVTCVFNSGKVEPQYKAVNIKPAGILTVRRKLSSVPKATPVSLEDSGVPFPTNIKTRHPLFGTIPDDEIKNQEQNKKSRACSSPKKKRKSQVL